MPRSGGTGEGFRIIGDSNDVDNDNILTVINLDLSISTQITPPIIIIKIIIIMNIMVP